MEFFRDTNYNFVKYRFWAIIVSALITVAGMFSIIAKGGLPMGVDFKGGVLLEVAFNELPEVSEVRSALKTIGLEDSIIQQVSGRKDVIIRLKQEKIIKKEAGNIYQKVNQQIIDALEKKFGKDSFRFDRVEYVGPMVGKDLKRQGMLAAFLSCAGIILYLSFRFDFKFGIAAIIALLHDVFIAVSFFSFFNKEFTLTILAAILTIIGYSVNDSIVVFDRIRENIRLHSKEEYSTLINRSINETLSRTVITSVTTFFAILILYLFGGPVIHDFAFALMIGIISGTYSSIYIASPVLIDWDRIFRKKK